MRAVMIVGAAERGRTSALDLLVDRPFVEHVVEQLAAGGVESIDVLAGPRSDAVREVLADGERWGVSLTYHVAEEPYGAVQALPGMDAEPEVLLVHADALVPASSWSRPLPDGALEVYLTTDGAPEWTGWCRCAGALLAATPSEPGRRELLAALASRASARSDLPCDALSVGDESRLLEANARALAGGAPFVSIHAQRGADGVWTQNGVRVHPTAALAPPLFLGACVEVGPRARLGPGAVIGAESIVDREATVRDSLIAQHTYVGPGARCEQVVGLNGGVHVDPDGRALPAELAAALVDLRRVSVGASARVALAACLAHAAAFAQAAAHAVWSLVPHVEPTDEVAT